MADSVARQTDLPVGDLIRLVSSPAEAYARAVRAREVALAMSPIATPEVSGPSPYVPTPRARPGVSWVMTAASQLPLAVRAVDLSSRKVAVADARAIVSRAAELEVVTVADARGRRAWWLALDGLVVLVAASLASPSLVNGQARRAVNALTRLGAWS